MPHRRAALDLGPDPVGTLDKIDPAALRRLNVIRILDAVRRHGPISRASLARRSRLSPPAVSALVDELIAGRGLLREVGRDVSTGGRRPRLVGFAAERGAVVGVDIGSTRLRYALADLDGRILGRREEATGNPAPAALLRQVGAGIDRLVEGSRKVPSLRAIGVGAPGMTDVRRGVVIEAANLRGWVDVPLRDMLARRFGVPVAVDNDVNMAALGEYWVGCAKRVPNFVFIALGRGIGAGIMIDGRLYRGSQWYAGEIGHVLLDCTQWKRSAGRQGCLERQAGAAALARRWRASAPGGGGEAGDAAALFAAARRGEPVAAKIVEEAAVALGVAVANIVTTLDPALVVVGGGLGQAGEALLEPVRQVVRRVAPNRPVIRATALEGQAQVFGSVLTALRLANQVLYEEILAGGDGARRPARAAGRPAAGRPAAGRPARRTRPATGSA